MLSRVPQVRWAFGLLLALIVLLFTTVTATADVDTALIISVDVSSSVDERRYQLQMEGIAAALEDKSVIEAILAGPQAAIQFIMLTWTDKAQVAIPWTRIANIADAKAIATRVRKIPQLPGDFTCMTRMLQTISDKIVTQLPEKAARVVVDVSGDGSENCNPELPTATIRDGLVANGVTVNGLPILEGREAETLEGRYRQNVMGGPGSFVLAANGFKDFGRAIRQKFIVEISGLRAEGLRAAEIGAGVHDHASRLKQESME